MSDRSKGRNQTKRDPGFTRKKGSLSLSVLFCLLPVRVGLSDTTMEVNQRWRRKHQKEAACGAASMRGAPVVKCECRVSCLKAERIRHFVETNFTCADF